MKKNEPPKPSPLDVIYISPFLLPSFFVFGNILKSKERILERLEGINIQYEFTKQVI